MNGIPSTCTPINPALSRYSIDAPSPVDFLVYRDAVKPKPQRRDPDEWIPRMRQMLLDGKTLHEAAKEIGIAPAYMSATYKRETGATPVQWMRAHGIRTAQAPRRRRSFSAKGVAKLGNRRVCRIVNGVRHYLCRGTCGLVNKRLKLGWFARPTRCQRCKLPLKLDAHHADYSKPEEVHFICRSCHMQAHQDPAILDGITPTNTDQRTEVDAARKGGRR